MTLAQYKAYCAAKLGLSDSVTLAQAGEFVKARWRMIWNSQLWRQTRYYDTVAVPAGTQEITLTSPIDFILAARWNGITNLAAVLDLSVLATNPAAWDGTGTPIAFVPLAQDATGQTRLRLLQRPQQDGTLLLAGKRKCIELVLETDSPILPGVDETLVAFVMADLYQYLRQFAKAQACQQEGTALLQKMVEIETSQASEVRQIIPEEQVLGYSDPSKGYW